MPWDSSDNSPFGSRDNPNQAFYNSGAWRLASKSNLQDNPLCQACHSAGNIKAANLTDHAVPINRGGSKFNRKNHLSLCHDCHNRKSGLESHTPILCDTWTVDGELLPRNIQQIIDRINESN